MGDENVYRVHWEHEDGHASWSANIHVTRNDDVVVEHINVLTQFHAIFTGTPPVAKILLVELVGEKKD